MTQMAALNVLASLLVALARAETSFTLWEASGFDVSAFLVQLESAVGRWPDGRVPDVVTSMHPTFTALPKNQYGNLDAAGVRYTVSRFFKHEYNWHLKSLDAAGEAWNSTSPMEVLRSHLPTSSMAAWEGRLERRGFGLPETAAIAVALESLIRAEAMEKIEVAYRMHSLSTDVDLFVQDLDAVLETYMAGYILNNSMLDANQDTASLQQNRMFLNTQISEYYPFWNQTQAFVRETRARMVGGDKPIAFEKVRRVVMRLQEQWWVKLNHECSGNKKVLLSFEDQATGCVRVTDFYGKMVDQGYWQFGESLPYLRDMGVLDETNPENPHIIIPNYITAKSNCVPNSRFYSTCCLDECEDLQLHLERRFATDSATPKEIIAAIATLPSSTTPATPGMRALPKEMLRHLDTIAQADGGRIELHGHLFAQWMHHAYPRECSYPHLAGTTHQMSVDDYQATGAEPVFSEAEAKGVVNTLNQSRLVAIGLATCTPWTEGEEYIVSPATNAAAVVDEDEQSIRTAMRFMAPSAAIVTLGIMLIRSFTVVRRRTGRSGAGAADKKFKLPL
jgi:hypothetical protein